MIDARRARKPKLRPEVFGLATLDTVTCALGGSIMLLVLMASITDPRAAVALVDTRNFFQSGDGDNGLQVSSQAGHDESVEVRNLAMIYIDTQNETRIVASPGNCAELDGSVLEMGASEQHFDQERLGKNHGIAIWPEQVPENCRKFALELSYDPAPSGCRITLVSGNHFQQKPQSGQGFATCPAKIRLRSTGRGVFQFDRGS